MNTFLLTVYKIMYLLLNNIRINFKRHIWQYRVCKQYDMNVMLQNCVLSTINVSSAWLIDHAAMSR